MLLSHTLHTCFNGHDDIHSAPFLIMSYCVLLCGTNTQIYVTSVYISVTHHHHHHMADVVGASRRCSHNVTFIALRRITYPTHNAPHNIHACDTFLRCPFTTETEKRLWNTICSLNWSIAVRIQEHQITPYAICSVSCDCSVVRSPAQTFQSQTLIDLSSPPRSIVWPVLCGLLLRPLSDKHILYSMLGAGWCVEKFD